MFKFTKAKTAADTEGSESKDTYERSENRRQRIVLRTKEQGVYIFAKERENPAWHLTWTLSAGSGASPAETRAVPGKRATELLENNTGEARNVGRGFSKRSRNFH